MSARELLAMISVAASAMVMFATAAGAQAVTKENVPGVVNFARVETTVACAGVTNISAIPQVKQMGFVSIINLRESSEPGANVEEEEAAAKAVGLRYYHVPFNGQAPDPAAADKFLEAITTAGTEPAFIHCSGGNRAAAMWMIKRLVVDHWDVDRATKEATDLGLVSPKLKQFAIDYAQTHKR